MRWVTRVGSTGTSSTWVSCARASCPTQRTPHKAIRSPGSVRPRPRCSAGWRPRPVMCWRRATWARVSTGSTACPSTYRPAPIPTPGPTRASVSLGTAVGTSSSRNSAMPDVPSPPLDFGAAARAALGSSEPPPAKALELVRRLRSALCPSLPPPEAFVGDRVLEARWWWAQSLTTLDEAKAFFVYGMRDMGLEGVSRVIDLGGRAVGTCPAEHPDRSAMAASAADIILDACAIAPQLVGGQLARILDTVQRHCDLLPAVDAAPRRVRALPLSMAAGASAAEALIVLDGAMTSLQGRPMGGAVAGAVRSMARLLAVLGEGVRAMALLDDVERGLGLALDEYAGPEVPAAIAEALATVRSGGTPAPLDVDSMTMSDVAAAEAALSTTQLLAGEQMWLRLDRAMALLDVGRTSEAATHFTAIMENPAPVTPIVRAQAQLLRGIARLDPASEVEVAAADVEAAVASVGEESALGWPLVAYARARISAARGAPDADAAFEFATHLTDGTRIGWRTWAARAAHQAVAPRLPTRQHLAARQSHAPVRGGAAGGRAARLAHRTRARRDVQGTPAAGGARGPTGRDRPRTGPAVPGRETDRRTRVRATRGDGRAGEGPGAGHAPQRASRAPGTRRLGVWRRGIADGRDLATSRPHGRDRDRPRPGRHGPAPRRVVRSPDRGRSEGRRGDSRRGGLVGRGAGRHSAASRQPPGPGSGLPAVRPDPLSCAAPGATPAGGGHRAPGWGQRRHHQSTRCAPPPAVARDPPGRRSAAGRQSGVARPQRLDAIAARADARASERHRLLWSPGRRLDASARRDRRSRSRARGPGGAVRGIRADGVRSQRSGRHGGEAAGGALHAGQRRNRAAPRLPRHDGLRRLHRWPPIPRRPRRPPRGRIGPGRRSARCGRGAPDAPAIRRSHPERLLDGLASHNGRGRRARRRQRPWPGLVVHRRRCHVCHREPAARL